MAKNQKNNQKQTGMESVDPDDFVSGNDPEGGANTAGNRQDGFADKPHLDLSQKNRKTNRPRTIPQIGSIEDDRQNGGI